MDDVGQFKADFLAAMALPSTEPEPEPTLPLNGELFALTDVGAEHWLVMDGWTLDESALLLAGANPKRINEFGKDPHVYKPDFTSCGYVGILDRLHRAAEMGVLHFPAPPQCVVAWAAGKHAVPVALCPGNATSESGAGAVTAHAFGATATEQGASSMKRVLASTAHENTILAKLQELGFDPLALPSYPRGRPSPAKQAVLTALNRDDEDTRYEKAWKSLTADDRIKYR